MSGETTYTVSNYLLDRLREAGVGHVFGVPGDFGFPFMDTIEADPAMQWVGACNELNAAYAADAYARVRGLAAVTGSAGVLEMGAAGGIAGAYAEEVALLVISGFPTDAERAAGTFTHHSLRGSFDKYEAMLAPVTAAQVALRASTACAQIDDAINRCRAGRAPVYVQFPRDVQQLPAVPPQAPLASPEPTSDPAQLRSFLDRAVDMLAGSTSSAVLVDFPASRYGLTGLIQDLSASAGIPFATTRAGRSGPVDQTHPGYLGTYSASPLPSEVNRRIESADVLIRVCPRHDETNHGVADPHAHDPRFIDLQGDAAVIGSQRYDRVAARDVLDGLRALLPAASPVLSPTPGGAAFDPRPDTALTQDRLWEAVASFVAPEDTIVLDFGTCQALSDLRLPVPTTMLTQTTWSAIGYSVPALLGAQLANPRSRHLHIVGDGGFQETAQEISTVLRNGLAPITIVLNNGHYAVENITHENPPVDLAYNELHSWRYARLPGVFGARPEPHGVRVTSETELAEALGEAAEACRDGRYSLIEVAVAPLDVARPLRETLDLYLQNSAAAGPTARGTGS